MRNAMRQLLGTRLSKQQRKEVDEAIAEAIAKLRNELQDRDIEAIGFKYEPVSSEE